MRAVFPRFEVRAADSDCADAQKTTVGEAAVIMVARPTCEVFRPWKSGEDSFYGRDL